MRLGGFFASAVLHVAFAWALILLSDLGRKELDLSDALIVPIEAVTAEETNIRAASPEVAELSPVFEDRGETLAAEAATPTEPLESVEPLPVPRRETPPRQQRLDLNDLDALLSREDAERGDRARDAGPDGERSPRPRAAIGAGTALTATQTARIASLLASQIEPCARSAADRANPDLVTGLRIRLTRAGALDGAPVVTRSSGDGAFDDSARRAVRLCSPYDLGDLQQTAAGVDLLINYAPGSQR